MIESHDELRVQSSIHLPSRQLMSFWRAHAQECKLSLRSDLPGGPFLPCPERFWEESRRSDAPGSNLTLTPPKEVSSMMTSSDTVAEALLLVCFILEDSAWICTKQRWWRSTFLNGRWFTPYGSSSPPSRYLFYRESILPSLWKRSKGIKSHCGAGHLGHGPDVRTEIPQEDRSVSPVDA